LAKAIPYLRTTKLEGRFEIQPHLEEHALHWKVGQSPKASRIFRIDPDCRAMHHEVGGILVLHNCFEEESLRFLVFSKNMMMGYDM
jgi:hypothetical protein